MQRREPRYISMVQGLVLIFLGLLLTVGVIAALVTGDVISTDSPLPLGAVMLISLVAVVATMPLPLWLGIRWEGCKWPFDGHHKGGKTMKWSEGLKSAAACVVAGAAWLIGGVMGFAWWHVVIAVCATAVMIYSILAHVRLAKARRQIRKLKRRHKAGGTD